MNAWNGKLKNYGVTFIIGRNYQLGPRYRKESYITRSTIWLIVCYTYRGLLYCDNSLIRSTQFQQIFV